MKNPKESEIDRIMSLLLSRDLFSRVNEGIKRVINRSSACINFDESKFFLFFSLSFPPSFSFFSLARDAKMDSEDPFDTTRLTYDRVTQRAVVNVN